MYSIISPDRYLSIALLNLMMSLISSSNVNTVVIPSVLDNDVLLLDIGLLGASISVFLVICEYVNTPNLSTPNLINNASSFNTSQINNVNPTNVDLPYLDESTDFTL